MIKSSYKHAEMSYAYTNLISNSRHRPGYFLTLCGLPQRLNAKGALFVALFFFFQHDSQAQPKSGKLGFTAIFSQDSVHVGDTLEVILTAKVPNGWYVYSEKSDCPADDGPLRAEWNYNFNTAAAAIGATYGVGDALVRDDEIWKCATGEFTKTVEFRQKIIVQQAGGTITATFYGQRCSTQDGMCVLIQEEIQITLPPSP
jgi:hypothetical protein